jgi:nitroimidazol reductase NimA-like FMN-containing flavoprotein (pyridoxamine 5'-phosphate oxidase superfamily)
MVKVHKAMPNAPGMVQSEVDTFLTSTKGPLRLGTVDAKGDPMIHPLWFYYLNERLYILSLKDNLKGSEH